MTSPENIVVSLEMARRLKEAGWPQDNSCFYWLRCGDGKDDFSVSRTDVGRNSMVESFAAPTAEELLRRLPYKINTTTRKKTSIYGEMFDTFTLEIRVLSNRTYRIYYKNKYTNLGRDPSLGGFKATDILLCNSLASMFIYLSTHHLLSPEQ